MINPSYVSLSQREISRIKSRVKNNVRDSKFLDIVRCLSDATRLKIFMLLAEKDSASVGDISQVVGAEQSATSHALRDLKNLGLVENYRCGKQVCYYLKKDKLTKKLISFFQK